MKERVLAIALSLGLIGATVPTPVRANDDLGEGRKIRHALLISVDGLHALDVANYVAAHPDSALAEHKPRRYVLQCSYPISFGFLSGPSGAGYWRIASQSWSVLRCELQSQCV